VRPTFEPFNFGDKMTVTLRRFGVTATNPSVLSTTSNNLVLFEQPLQPTFTNADLVMLPYGASGAGSPNAYGSLGLKAMSRFLLIPPAPAVVQTIGLYAVASGTITIPSSAVNATVNVILNQNYFHYQAQTIEVVSDPMASLTTPASLTPGIYSWSLLGAIGGAYQTVLGQYQTTINGITYSGTYVSNRPGFQPLIQLSIGLQFTGTITGTDVWGGTLTQFELQHRNS